MSRPIWRLGRPRTFSPGLVAVLASVWERWSCHTSNTSTTRDGVGEDGPDSTRSWHGGRRVPDSTVPTTTQPTPKTSTASSTLILTEGESEASGRTESTAVGPEGRGDGESGTWGSFRPHEKGIGDRQGAPEVKLRPLGASDPGATGLGLPPSLELQVVNATRTRRVRQESGLAAVDGWICGHDRRSLLRRPAVLTKPSNSLPIFD
jgi:hypothetical protein